MQRVKVSSRRAPMIIAMGLLAACVAGPAAADEDARFWQRVLRTSGQVPANFTPPEPLRFEVVLEMGDIKQAQAWLDAGLDPDYLSPRLGTGMMIGAWIGNIPMMELFYERGAEVNMVNSAGEQALLMAAWKGNQAAVD